MSSLKLNNKARGKRATVSSSNSIPLSTRILQMKDKFIAWFMPKSIVEKFVWAYLACVIISFIFGIDHYLGFWGADGWNMGLLTQCIMIAGFFAIAKVWEPNMWPVWCAMAGSTVVMLLGIVMRFGIDPLGNYYGLEDQYIQSFVSTIGQTSWYSAFICTVIPVGVTLFYISEKKKMRVIAALYTVLSFLALAIADSDSVFMGVAGMMLVLLWFAFTNEKYMVRFFEITTILAGSYVLMEGAKTIFSEYYNGGNEINSVGTGDIKLYISVLFASILVLFILYLLYRTGVLKRIYAYCKVLNTLRFIVFFIVILLIMAAILYIVLNTRGFFGVTDDIIPYYSGNIWYFNDAWGNNRGGSWKTCWSIFCDYSIGRKLIGIGPDSLAAVIQYNDKYRDMIANIFGEEQILTCAHNEFYNHIVVYGILGGLSYLGIFISGCVNYIKSAIKKPEVLLGATCIAAYMGHNFFCYQTVICTPLIFVIIGICESVLANTNKN